MNIRTMAASVLILLALASMTSAAEFGSDWPTGVQRIWIGPDYWANRLQDWRIADGRLECLISAPDRNVHLLTRELGEGGGRFDMSIRFGFLNRPAHEIDEPWIGFRIGARGRFDDYRDSAVRGRGLDVGVRMNGELFIGEGRLEKTAGEVAPLSVVMAKEIALRIAAEPHGDRYRITLSSYDPAQRRMLASVERHVPAEMLAGNIALVSHYPRGKGASAQPSVWFDDWRIAGEKLQAHDERAFGPILFAQYTLSKRVLKMTAQMAPVGEQDGQTVRLQIADGDGWKTIGRAPIDPDARTATFRIADWDGSRDVPYRIAYDLAEGGGRTVEHEWRGTIRREPVDKDEIVVAAFTGNNDLGFPNNDLVAVVLAHDPDVLFFSGDQIYEGVAGYGVQRAPVDKACLDYLRKWWLLGWAYKDMIRDRPTICTPDDHDVYHGNLWGAGGKATGKEGSGSDQQDTGGYKMPARWVKMVECTQTSHLPDPYDPTPVLQGIGVYYCDMTYGGVSFAIIEDRKFKSAPRGLLPEADVRNGWPRSPKFDAKKSADVTDAVLLGERQLAFLHDWAADWSHGVWMKAVLSQTIFANVATLPEGERNGSVTPRLRINRPGEYAPNEWKVADMDSNGWPESGRNRALREIRRAFATHIAGDQHLGSTIQYGVDDWHDAPYALCVPSISNVWPRRWFPAEGGANRAPGAPKYTGDFEDGFGNKMTVHAVSNPVFTGKEPSNLYDRATGYGIIRFRRTDRDVIVECWPRFVDPNAAGAEPYGGWPVRFNQMDNHGRNALGHLPRIEVTGMTDPVVQVINEADGEIVYTIRIKGRSFRPMVFEDGTYTVTVGEPGTEKMRTLEHLSLESGDGDASIVVGF